MAALMRCVVLLLAFAGCAGSDSSGEALGDHLIVHVANAVPFDRVDYHFQAPDATPLTITDFHVLPLRSTAQWDEWKSVGQGWTDVTVDAFADHALLATATTHITSYNDQGDGVFLADLTLQLAPTP